jgi:hypothetical protein
MAHFGAHAGGVEPFDDALQHGIERRLRREAYGAERRTLLALRRSGDITEDVYRSLEWDLDLAESRLE